MRRIVMSALTIGLAFVPATLNAQQPGAPRAHAHARFAGNAARVLALPTVLELTARQVTQLEQIRDRTQAQNQPLLEQLQAARPERPARERGNQRAQGEERAQMMEARRAEMQAQRERLKPVLEQLRQNAETSRREVESVLTSEQVAKLRELEGARRPEGARRRGGMGGPQGLRSPS